MIYPRESMRDRKKSTINKINVISNCNKNESFKINCKSVRYDKNNN